jgi:P-type Ca2+ transporter type 2C
VSVAIICFLALFIKWLVVNKGWNNDKVNDNGPLQVGEWRTRA